MPPAAVAGVVFGCTFGGAVLGMALRRVLPDPHLGDETKDVTKMGTGLVGTTSGIVLGLLIASAKTTFDGQRAGFQQAATNMVLLDRTLVHYGPEAQPARDALRRGVADAIDQLWPPGGPADPTAGGFNTAVYDAIRDLTPRTDAQRAAQLRAFQLCDDLTRTRFALSYKDDAAIPTPLLAVLVSWLTVLFTTFGLFAPRNGTAVAVLFVCAVSVSSAILLLVDMAHPFEGLFQISGDPLRRAHAVLGQ